jgi:hypothetical protein
MAVAYIQEFALVEGDRSTTNYDAVKERLNIEQDPPAGLIVHTAGFDPEAGVFRLFDVWESREHAQRFMDERLMPIIGKMLESPNPPEPPTRDGFYDLHDVVDG